MLISRDFKMKLSLYNQIIEEISNVDGKNVLKDLTIKFPRIPSRTLGSIYAQEYQRRTKRNHYKHHSPEAMKMYFDRFYDAVQVGELPGIILRMADEIDLSPCLLARIILECYVNKHKVSGENNNSIRHQVTRLLKDTSLIEDRNLALETFLCVLNDDNYGPVADTIKHSIGYEHECKLRRKLEELKITFIEEEHMRAKGYDKTPDFKLEIPLAINGFIVNWIESKASFGDEESHQTYLREQFWSYWNRFGSGMVIYWFGFIEELDVYKDKGIMLQNDFPDEITMMDPTSIY